MNKPFSQACENNKDFILEILQTELENSRQVLEVGSGTGQHAAYFARKLPHLIWQTSDQALNHPGIEQWLHEAHLPNTPAPLTIDVRNYAWAETQYDAVFTANSLHIMELNAARLFIGNVARALHEGGRFIVYGPFNYNGEYTSESNARFDVWLGAQDSRSAIRDFEMLDRWAQSGDLRLEQDHTMPANNRLLVWRKKSSRSEGRI